MGGSGGGFSGFPSFGVGNISGNADAAENPRSPFGDNVNRPNLEGLASRADDPTPLSNDLFNNDSFSLEELGNIISFLVFLAPLPTFYRICRKKSSEGFHSMPYSISFFSASLLLYYAYLKTNAYMIVSINGIGCMIEAIYIFLYILYAPKKVKLPNILGLLLGVTQMILYCIYKDKKKSCVQTNFEVEKIVSNSGNDIEMNMNFGGNEKKGVDTNFELEENVSDLKNYASNENGF
ncbi:hypothetical protein SASPL_123328 [Salvia splendens]|uniref:Bidirectional sugar transporter SWEET n=1 Tax=Salvia splendens TaxID=180675 RepID=A0A8X8XN16_SALSN|nr:hypothetical protein SASPL_123328 [Salvia splendens]